MKLLNLVREPSGLGELSEEGAFLFYTLELPWRDNQKDISCIPLGEYTCKRVNRRYLSGGGFVDHTFEVLDVPDRSGILFHVGNTYSDTHGCILLGSEHRMRDGELFLAKSKQAFFAFMDYMEGEENFRLNITEAE